MSYVGRHIEQQDDDAGGGSAQAIAPSADVAGAEIAALSAVADNSTPGDSVAPVEADRRTERRMRVHGLPGGRVGRLRGARQPVAEADGHMTPDTGNPAVARVHQLPPASTEAERLATYLADRGNWTRLRLGIDVLALAVTVVATLTIGMSLDTVGHVVSIGFALAVLAILHSRPAPDDRLNASMLATATNVVGVSSLGAMLTISVDAIFNGNQPVSLALRLWLFSAVLLGLARVTLLLARRHGMRRDALATPTLIVGAGVVGAHLAHRLTSESYGMRPVGYLDANPLPRSKNPRAPHLPVLGSPEDLERAIRETGARHVILSFSSGPDHLLVTTVRRCEQLGVEVSLVPRLYESINERSTLDHVGGIPLLTLHPIDPEGWQFAIKHSIDRSAALLALLVLSPIMAVIAALVKLSSRGPALFRQRRVGRDGREFDVLKFRTMKIGVPATVAFELPDGVAPGGVEGEDRRTPIGRWLRDLSLDELPQLINVLRGDMSLVGPRPERPDYARRFALDVVGYEDRHRVKSGITGWAQVHGLRGQTSIADRVEWDNYYIQNWSLRLDFRIMLLTVAEMLRQRDSGPCQAAATVTVVKSDVEQTG
jgi:exopolysaccharide biosynthesis polyprenyl glycosylphosphotransferase